MQLRKDIGEGVRNIIFDLGGVVIDIDPMKSVEAFSRLCGVAMEVKNIFPVEDDFFLEYELGNITDDEFAEGIRRSCPAAAYEDIRTAWCALIGAPDARRFELLDSLKPAYRTFVLSNTNGFHVGRIRGLFEADGTGRSFDSYFERCFYSQEMHLHKPDRAIYDAVIAETGIVPAETLFIDDRAENFSGARQAGLRVYHLTGGETLSDLFL